MTKPVFQPEGSKCCVLACIASVTGCSLETVIETAKAESLNFDINKCIPLNKELLIFQKLGFASNVLVHSNLSSNMYLNRLYLVTVPSLTKVGDFHRIVVICIDTGSEVVPIIHDPQPTGDRYGVTHKLIRFTEVVEIINSPLELIIK